MRRVLTFVAPLAVAALAAFAPAAFAGGGERQDPLAVADQLEREGRSHLEQGHKAEGAKLLSKAWAIRAEVFAHGDGKQRPDDARKHDDGDRHAKHEVRPEIEALMARLEHLRMTSQTSAHEAKELAAAGRSQDAERKREESEKLSREATELHLKLQAIGAAKSERAEFRSISPEQQAELRSAIARLTASMNELRLEAEHQAAAGNETAAMGAQNRAHEQARKIEELSQKLRGGVLTAGSRGAILDATQKPAPDLSWKRRSDGSWELTNMPAVFTSANRPDANVALAQQLEKLMSRMEKMQQRLEQLERRMQKEENDDDDDDDRGHKDEKDD